MEVTVKRFVNILPVIIIFASLVHQRTARFIGISTIVFLLMETRGFFSEQLFDNAVLWSLTPAGLLLCSSVSEHWLHVGIQIIVCGISLHFPQLFDRNFKNLFYSIFYLVVIFYLFPSKSLSCIFLTVTRLSVLHLRSKLSTHDTILVITSLSLIFAHLYHLLITSNSQIHWEDIFSATTCIVVFEVAFTNLLLMIIVSHVLTVIMHAKSGWMTKLSKSAINLHFSSIILVRIGIFVMVVLFISLFVVIPMLTHILTVNPFVWLGMLYQLNDLIAVYFTSYWVVVICLFVMLANWSMKSSQLTKTQGRKIFHGLMLLMFVPALLTSSSIPFVNLCLGGALCIFVMIEFIRLYILQGDTIVINQYFELFVTGSEANAGHAIILSHISLLMGCASSIWYSGIMDSPLVKMDEVSEVLIPFSGLLTVGIGDSAAAVVGSSIGRRKWLNSNKTIEGSVAAYFSMLAFSFLIQFYKTGEFVSGKPLFLLCGRLFLVTLAEVFVESNDNISLPLYLMIITI